MLKIIFLFLIGLCLKTIVSAQYEMSPEMTAVVQSLNLNVNQVDMDLSVEKPMRYLPEMIAFAVMEKKFSSDNREDYEHLTYDCHVVMYNASDKKITNKYTIISLESDAIRLSGVNFDFAPYKVKSDGTRAFGLRIKYSGPSRVNQYEEEKLTLFIPEKDKLTPILNNYTSYLYTGEWDTNCAGEFNEKSAFFILQSEQTNGFFGIQVNFKNVKTINTPVGDDCDSKEIASKSTEFLVFKNGIYQLKK
jgi:hypothetical protein